MIFIFLVLPSIDKKGRKRLVMLEKLTQEETQKRFCGILKKKSDGVIEIKIHV